MNLSEKLLLDASEFLNAVYDDMSQINEILTLRNSTLIIEGSVLLYRGFHVVSSLDPLYLRTVLRIANLYDLLERSNNASEEVIIDYFYVRKDGETVMDLSMDASLEADDDYVRQVID